MEAVASETPDAFRPMEGREPPAGRIQVGERACEFRLDNKQEPLPSAYQAQQPRMEDVFRASGEREPLPPS